MRLNGTITPALRTSAKNRLFQESNDQSVDPIERRTAIESGGRRLRRQRATWAGRFHSPVCLFHNRYHILKRVLDVTLCLALLVIALPIMMVTSVLIWLEDPGQVLLDQRRTGRAGRRFRMYKFRTMVKNADELKEKYAHLNEHTWPDFKITRDPRVTRIGYILRKLSLDELPQLFNVLKGEMSLVGPRPTSFSASTYAAWHNERLEVLPGITGLAQVSGRNDVDFDDRIRLDIEYIERQSLWFDLQILMRTFFSVFARHGAY